jgi:hypothetical protein
MIEFSIFQLFYLYAIVYPGQMRFTKHLCNQLTNCCHSNSVAEFLVFYISCMKFIRKDQISKASKMHDWTSLDIIGPKFVGVNE